jgi:hypothetical protein
VCKASLLSFVDKRVCVNAPNSKHIPPNLWHWYYVTPKFINPTIHFSFSMKGKGLNAKDRGGRAPFLFATCAGLFHVQKAHQVNARTPSTNLSPSKEAALHKRGEK